MRPPDRRVTAAAVVCLSLSGGLVACGGKSKSKTVAAVPSKASFTLKVGDIVPLTGDLAVFGPAGAKAAHLAIQEANAALKKDGIGIKVVGEDQDEQTNPQAAVSAARKLVSDGATCLAGAWASADTIPVAESVSSREGIPQISPASTSAQISVLNSNGYLFRTAPSDNLQGQALARVVAKAVGPGKTISLAARNDAYGSGFIDKVNTTLKSLGEKTTGPVLYDPAAASYDSEAAKIVAGNPAAYVIIDFPQTYAKVGDALLRTGKFDVKKLFTADGLAAATIPPGIPAGALDGARGTRPGTPKSGTAAIAFSRLFANSPGTKARETFDAQNFDATTLCILASVAAGSNNGSAIKSELRAVSGPPGPTYTFQQLPQAFKALREGKKINYEGASGPIDFNAHGDPSTAVYEDYAYQSGKLAVTGQFFAHASG